MSIFMILGLLAGGFVPIQTSVNAKLGRDTQESFLSSGISFFVGTLFLILLSLVTWASPFIGFHDLALLPWWGYLGGLLAMMCLTMNIFLFDALGSVLAIVLPMVGQIVLSALIDNFGWFGTQAIPLTGMRILGAGLVMVGIIFIVVLPTLGQRRLVKQPQQRGRFLWAIGGIVSGMVYATEMAINGRVGTLVHSPIHAAFLTFLIATVGLFLVVSLRGHLTNLTLVRQKKTPWWAFLGGVIGGFSVYLAALLVPQIGNGSAIVLGILGQIVVSLLIDTFGWFGGVKRAIARVQVLGLLVLVTGVVFIELL